MVTIEFYDEDTKESTEFGRFNVVKIRHSIIYASYDGQELIEIGHQRHDGFWQFNDNARRYCYSPRDATVDPNSIFSHICVGDA